MPEGLSHLLGAVFVTGLTLSGAFSIEWAYRYIKSSIKGEKASDI